MIMFYQTRGRQWQDKLTVYHLPVGGLRLGAVDGVEAALTHGPETQGQQRVPVHAVVRHNAAAAIHPHGQRLENLREALVLRCTGHRFGGAQPHIARSTIQHAQHLHAHLSLGAVLRGGAQADDADFDDASHAAHVGDLVLHGGAADWAAVGEDAVNRCVVHLDPLGHVGNVGLAAPVVDELEYDGGGVGADLKEAAAVHAGVLVPWPILDSLQCWCTVGTVPATYQ